MHVINYLNSGKTLEDLNIEFGIKVSSNELFKDIFVLNYDQINSPKNHGIVKECRSLVLGKADNNKFVIISRAFDRFFNYGENDFFPSIEDLTCFEKIDGSLISVFYTEEYGWLYRTKSMIMPTLPVNGFERTWKEIIEPSICWGTLPDNLNKDNTYIFEVVSRENRVVVKYEECCAYLLAVRNNNTGDYVERSEILGLNNFKSPRKYTFSSTKQCMESVRNLPNLEEGYVAYTANGIPVCKIKSPAYLAAHRIKGEGLTPPIIRELVVINEQDEYLSVFPEDKHYFEKYLNLWNNIKEDILTVWDSNKYIQDKKEFALKVKDYPFSAVLFKCKSINKDPIIMLTEQSENYKIKLLEQYES